MLLLEKAKAHFCLKLKQMVPLLPKERALQSILIVCFLLLLGANIRNYYMVCLYHHQYHS